jgi:putative ABC transport system ATP-binding protein
MEEERGASIVLDGVTKSYGAGTNEAVVAADHVCLRIDPGSMVALSGASGSGKSTLLHLIGAIDHPDSGTVVTNGIEVSALRGSKLSDYRRTVGFVFQRYNLLPALSALDNVIAPVLPYRTSFDKKERARELLSDVGLGGREKSIPSQMSGGEQQRVAIARALMNRPSLLLADEPTGNLDSTNASEVLALLEDLRIQRQMTMILATHDAQVAARCERLIRLRDGAVVDDMDLSEEYAAEEVIRRVGQLGQPL